MLIFSTVFLVFVGLASASGLDNWSQLVHKAQLLDQQLHEAVSAYQTAGYYVFGNLSKSFLMNPDLKQRMHSLHENPFTADNAEIRDVYNELKMDEDLWETLVDHVKLSDAFKVSILGKALTIEPPGLEQLMAKVQLIIREESKQNFSVPNAHLEALYTEMGIAGTADFMIVPNSLKHIAQATEEYCALPESKCSLALRASGQMFLASDEQVHKILPFDSEDKIHRIVATLPGYLRYRKLFGEGIANNHLECAPSGCWKRRYTTEKPEATTSG